METYRLWRERRGSMPLLLAPVFNSYTPEPVRIELPHSFYLISGNKKMYDIAARYLRNQMNENRHFFDKRVELNSLFLVADYPELKLTDDRSLIEEMEHKLNLAATSGICSIPYVITANPPVFGINYLKRSLDGERFHFTGRTKDIFLRLMRQECLLPTLAFRRYTLSLEKENVEDQLLDLWIALESLFVPDGKKGEITYKLRLRIAYYFGETFAERQRIAAFIKKSYNHRSEIVHSGKRAGDKLREEAILLRRMARAAILNLAMEGISIQEFRERLDELTLSGESYIQRFAPDFFERIEL
jgi:hypothetical protein